jgi:hypothetical protein
MYERLIVCLEYFDRNPFIKSIVSTLLYVLAIIIPVVVLISWELFYEYFRFPWAFSFNFFSFEWLNRLIEWIVEFIAMYLPVLVCVLFGAISVYSLLTRSSFLNFIILSVAKMFFKPILIANAITYLAGKLLGLDCFSHSEYLEGVLDLSLYFDSVETFSMLVFIVFFMDYAISKQSIIMREERDNNTEVINRDRLHVLRRWYFNRRP